MVAAIIPSIAGAASRWPARARSACSAPATSRLSTALVRSKMLASRELLKTARTSARRTSARFPTYSRIFSSSDSSVRTLNPVRSTMQVVAPSSMRLPARCTASAIRARATSGFIWVSPSLPARTPQSTTTPASAIRLKRARRWSTTSAVKIRTAPGGIPCFSRSSKTVAVAAPAASGISDPSATRWLAVSRSHCSDSFVGWTVNSSFQSAAGRSPLRRALQEGPILAGHGDRLEETARSLLAVAGLPGLPALPEQVAHVLLGHEGLGIVDHHHLGPAEQRHGAKPPRHGRRLRVLADGFDAQGLAVGRDQGVHDGPGALARHQFVPVQQVHGGRGPSPDIRHDRVDQAAHRLIPSRRPERSRGPRAAGRSRRSPRTGPRGSPRRTRPPASGASRPRFRAPEDLSGRAAPAVRSIAAAATGPDPSPRGAPRPPATPAGRRCVARRPAPGAVWRAAAGLGRSVAGTARPRATACRTPSPYRATTVGVQPGIWVKASRVSGRAAATRRSVSFPSTLNGGRPRSRAQASRATNSSRRMASPRRSRVRTPLIAKQSSGWNTRSAAGVPSRARHSSSTQPAAPARRQRVHQPRPEHEQMPDVFGRVVLLGRAQGSDRPVVFLPRLARLDPQDPFEQRRQSDLGQAEELGGHHGIEEPANLEREIPLHRGQVVGRSVQHLDDVRIGQHRGEGSEVADAPADPPGTPRPRRSPPGSDTPSRGSGAGCPTRSRWPPWPLRGPGRPGESTRRRYGPTGADERKAGWEARTA